MAWESTKEVIDAAAAVFNAKRAEIEKAIGKKAVAEALAQAAKRDTYPGCAMDLHAMFSAQIVKAGSKVVPMVKPVAKTEDSTVSAQQVQANLQTTQYG